MPIATPQVYARMLDAARSKGYAYPAINVTSTETMNATLRSVLDPACNAEPAVRAQWIVGVAMAHRAAHDTRGVPRHDRVEQAHAMPMRNPALDPRSA
jgi:fructose/tagatose bisphosphate aldolase